MAINIETKDPKEIKIVNNIRRRIGKIQGRLNAMDAENYFAELAAMGHVIQAFLIDVSLSDTEDE